MNKAKFITIEGIEGVGKSTIAKFVCEYLDQKGIPNQVTREPGGTDIAESIRNILLSHRSEAMCHETELLLLFAARMQNIVQVIRPNLEKGIWIICDRFTDASYAYQGGGRGIPIDKIRTLETWVHEGLQPDLTLLLAAPVSEALERAKKRNAPDRIESEELAFFERAQNQYLSRAKEDPSRIVTLNALDPLELVQDHVVKTLDNLILSAND